jgi:hypothetical protein
MCRNTIVENHWPRASHAGHPQLFKVLEFMIFANLKIKQNNFFKPAMGLKLCVLVWDWYLWGMKPVWKASKVCITVLNCSENVQISHDWISFVE